MTKGAGGVSDIFWWRGGVKDEGSWIKDGSGAEPAWVSAFISPSSDRALPHSEPRHNVPKRGNLTLWSSVIGITAMDVSENSTLV